MGLLAMAGTIIIGIYFILRLGWEILPLGVVGLLLVYFYTSWITRRPWICLIAPGLGFGPVMVMGVAFCQTGSYSLTAAMASIVPGILVSNLLLLNQFPDVEADAGGGRRHIPLSWGKAKAARLYGFFLLAPYGWLILMAGSGLLPWGSLLVCLTLPLAVKAVRGVPRHIDDIPGLIPLMGANVMVTLLTPALLALGMIIHRLVIVS
jgi:1,4-dihydroxy-2-naphthoate octaprenyltransferase